MMFLSAPMQYIRHGGKFFAVIVLFYCAFIAFFRGDIGTDTAAYISVFRGILDGEKAPYAEFGFYWLTTILLFLFNDPDISVKFVSLIFFFLLFVFLIRSNNDERFLLLSFVLPVFCYSYSMNVLRVGLAAAVCMLIFQSIFGKGLKNKLRYFLVAISFQYTSILIPLFFYFPFIDYKRIIKLSHVVIFLISFSIFLFLYGDYINDKLSLYSEFSSPSFYSGISNVVAVYVMLFFVFFGKLPKKDKVIIISYIGCFMSFFWIFSRITYAGLRVIDMMTFSTPFLILYVYRKKNLSFDFPIKLGIYLAGIILSVNIYMGYLSSIGEGDSPFLPYEFMSLLKK